MPRIRTIKPEFFRSRSLARCPVEVRMTFAGLWTEADDHGRGVADPRLLKGALWALDDAITHEHVSAHLRMLDETGHIRLYQVGGESYFEVVKWADHQAAAYRRGEPKYPAPEPPVRDVSHVDVQESADRTTDRAGTGNREQGRDEDLAASAAVDVGATHPMPVKGPDLARHLTSWAVEEGFERPDDRRPTPHVRWLLELVDQWLGTGTHSHGARMALLGEWCVLAGSEEPGSEAWGHLARLVKNYGGVPTLEAMHEATTNGAGLDEQWRDDPRALTKYATSVLKSREEAA